MIVSLDIIKKYNDKIDYWCQKKDKGIYDGFNLGMKLAKGDYIGFLNSDDVYTKMLLIIYLDILKIFLTKTLFLVQLKNIGVYYMDINHTKFIGVGVFIQAILQDFL